MVHNKKIVSLAVVFAMIMTMLSSFVIANAAETPEVYTKVLSSDETSAKVEIGFKNFAAEYADKAVGNTTIKVKVPEGFTATAITLGDKFAGATENVKTGVANTTGIVTVMKVDTEGVGYKIGTEGVIATVDFTLETAPTETTDYKFEVTEFKCTDVDMNSITLAKGDVTAGNAVHTVEVEQVVTGPAVYVSDAAVADGKVTVDIGFKNFAAEYADKAIGNTTIKVKIPEGFTATDITLGDKFAGATENVKTGVANTTGIVTVMKVDTEGVGYKIGTEGVIATVTFDAPADFDGKIKMEVTEFKCTDVDMNSITLAKGDVTAVAGKITSGAVAPTELTVKFGKDSVALTAGETVDVDVTVSNATAEAVVGVDSDNEDVATATYADGKVTVAAVSEGTAKITVTVTDGDVVKTADLAVTVSAKATTKPVVTVTVEGKDTVTANGGKVKLFKPALAGNDGVTAEMLEGMFADATMYQLLFDVTTVKGTTGGFVTVPVTGKEVKDAINGTAQILPNGISIIGAEKVVVNVITMDGATVSFTPAE